jgi:hypothetical protein
VTCFAAAALIAAAVFSPARADSGPASVCRGDLNADRAVNFGDLGLLRADFFSGNLRSDLNMDGRVSFADIGVMRENFFNECPAEPARLAEIPALEPHHRYALVRSIVGAGHGIVNVYVTGEGRWISDRGELEPETMRGWVVFASEARSEYGGHQP